MSVSYAATFEFDHALPITHRGTVAASSMATCFARAARDAVRAHPGLRWSSMSIVLLERLDAAAEPEATAEAKEAPSNANAHATGRTKTKGDGRQKHSPVPAPATKKRVGSRAAPGGNCS